MSRYLIYVRQSYRRDSDADVSEEQQEEAARRLLPKDATAEVIRDTGGRRSGATDQRDGYRYLLEQIQAPDVAGIAVYDLSRLARNARLMLNLKHELDVQNLHLIVSNLPDSRFDTAVGRFLFGQLCLAAQFQRDLDSERMVGLSRTKFDQGGHNGLDPFGYRSARNDDGSIARPHRLEIVEAEAALVRDIYTRYATGSVSTGALAAELNAAGHRRIVRARDERGIIGDVARPWTDKGITDILGRLDVYLGYVTYRRGRERAQGTHPPVITPELASAVERIKLRRHRPGRPDQQRRTYILPRLAYCGECGLRMRGETIARPGRKDIRYYRCPGRRDGRCSSSNVPADAVERRVVEHLADHATPPALLAAMRDELTRLRHIPDSGLRAQRARREQALARLRDAFVWGHIQEAEYHAQRRPIEVELANLPRPEDANVIAFDRTAGRLLPLAETLRGTGPEHQAKIVAHVVERVVLAGGNVAEMRVRLEARPFFAEIADGMAVAPPDGLEPPTQALGRPRSVH